MQTLDKNITLYVTEQSCSTFLDLLIRIVNLIFGRQGASWCPRAGSPEGTPPTSGGTPPSWGRTPPDDDFGGNPTDKATVGPPDVEEIDPTQNDAVRDWE
jgi:hypothetical protein